MPKKTRDYKFKKDCSCGLCKPLPGHRYHPQYGFDLDAVKDIPCLNCGKKIGDSEYTLELVYERFGGMMFNHKNCKAVKA
jgi:hypothetical protein